jgi:hypothetical protein
LALAKAKKTPIWVLEAKRIGSLFLASKIQKPKKHLFRCFLAYKSKPKS